MKKYYLIENGETVEEAIEAHCNDGFDSIEEAISAAPGNVIMSNGWGVIDENGKRVHEGEV